jgi:molecular chaperone DnaK
MSPLARRILRQAAELVGIEVTSFVKESTAALVRDWDALRACAYVVVFDWGGGTLDVSVLEIRADGISELWTNGLSSAGVHIDRELARVAHRRIMHERGQTKPFEGVPENDRDKLISQSERIKCSLSDSLGDGILAMEYGGAEVILEMTSEDLETVSAPFVEDAVKTLADAIASAGISPERVDQILVIGGSSKLPLLRKALESDRRFRARLHWPSEPDWAVANGAAVLEGKPGCFSLAETISLELSDSDQFPLAVPGDTAPGPISTLSVAIVDQKAPGAGGHNARIILNRMRPGELRPSPLRRFAVPVQGYVEEEIQLQYRLTSDQTFWIHASASMTGRRAVVQEPEELRFVYRLEGSH